MPFRTRAPLRRERERSSRRGEGWMSGEGIRADPLPFGARP